MAYLAALDRRTLLRWAAAAAATDLLPRRAFGQSRLPYYPFALGVASGAPGEDSVVLWTRLMARGFLSSLGNEPLAVRWEVAHDENFSRVARSGQTLARADLAHSVHVEVDGLEPDRWYFFRFLAGDAVSATGRTRTLPPAGARVQRLRLAYASCQRWEHGYFSAYRHMREEQLDAVLFLGDYIYEYPAAANPVRLHGGGWAQTLDGYRDRYALHKSDADLQAMHAACPWLVTWDDHEVQNDYAGDLPGDSGPPLADFSARRAAAYQAFYEHMPVRASALTAGLAGLAAGAEMRVYTRYPFGQLASIVLLDDRQYRDARACGRDGRAGSRYVNPTECAPWDDPARSLLGARQEAWLEACLAQRGPAWTVVGQQTLFGQRDVRPGPGQMFWNDGWDGYRAARKRFTAALEKHAVASPVLLGGDVHENWVGHVKADYERPESETVGVEFCGTSITSRSGGNARLAARLAENPHFIYAEAERKGYGVAELTPERLTTTLRVVDDVTRRDTRIETLARFTVAAGTRRVELG